MGFDGDYYKSSPVDDPQALAAFRESPAPLGAFRFWFWQNVRAVGISSCLRLGYEK
jgi:hypothetical protein